MATSPARMTSSMKRISFRIDEVTVLGDGESRLASLRQLGDSFDVEPAWLYPTHITRSEALIKETVEHTHRGGFIDMDTVDENLPQSLKRYIDFGGI